MSRAHVVHEHRAHLAHHMKVRDAALKLLDDREAAAESIERSVARNLHVMGKMGAMFVNHVRAAHPRYPFRAGLGDESNPLIHLPALPALQTRILERFGDAS